MLRVLRRRIPASLFFTFALVLSCLPRVEASEAKMAFKGESTQLKSTKVVPTLDTEIPPGSNAIWCSSFLAAWKSLSEDLAGGEILLEGSPELAANLNKANDPRPYAPEGSMYFASGWANRGIITKIHRELKAAFPDKKPPKIPDLGPEGFLAYSYLEVDVKFKLPYLQNRKPLEFTDSSGRKTRIRSFGIRSEDKYARHQLRSQPRVLYYKEYSNEGKNEDISKDEDSGGLVVSEFVIDLCAESSPSQIVVACINREPSMAKALARIDRELAEVSSKKKPDYIKGEDRIGRDDVLLVPDLFWQVSHNFSELVGGKFLNPKLKGYQIQFAQQDIRFRLNRNGAALKSEARVGGLFGGGYKLFVLNRPFLIFMRKRGSTEPFFAVWVDNAELLAPWVK